MKRCRTAATSTPHGASFPARLEPFIDLSTGINPNPYPVPRFPAGSLRPPAVADSRRDARGDRRAGLWRALGGARRARAGHADCCCRWSPRWCRRAARRCSSPSYAELARAAALAGHSVEARLANSMPAPTPISSSSPIRTIPTAGFSTEMPCSRSAEKICGRAAACSMVDEAFMDVGPPGASLAGEVSHGNIVVLRSFGKFFGLAGLRLGFALASPAVAARLRAALGPWAVSGPALAVGAKALADTAWIERTRRAAGAGRATARCHPRARRSRDHRRHEPVPAGADAGGRRIVSSPRACRNLRAALPRQCELAALRPAGE